MEKEQEEQEEEEQEQEEEQQQEQKEQEEQEERKEQDEEAPFQFNCKIIKFPILIAPQTSMCALRYGDVSA